MKLKKLAAAALAAVMSVAMLTGCGGGGGGNGGGIHADGSDTEYRLSKFAAEMEKTGECYIKGTAEVDGSALGTSGTVTIPVQTASKGDKILIFMGSMEEEGRGYLLWNDCLYELAEQEEDSWAWDLLKGGESEMESVACILAKFALRKGGFYMNKVEPNRVVKGQSFYAETVSTSLQGDMCDVTYCFKDDQLKYIMAQRGTEVLEEVETVSASIPDKMEALMNLRIN